MDRESMLTILNGPNGELDDSRGNTRPGAAIPPIIGASIRGGRFMGFLIGLSRAIDWLNDRLGTFANWCVLAACFISAANAMSRYAFDLSSNAWLEPPW